jgi:hypothetical protein
MRPRITWRTTAPCQAGGASAKHNNDLGRAESGYPPPGPHQIDVQPPQRPFGGISLAPPLGFEATTDRDRFAPGHPEHAATGKIPTQVYRPRRLRSAITWRKAADGARQ